MLSFIPPMCPIDEPGPAYLCLLSHLRQCVGQAAIGEETGRVQMGLYSLLKDGRGKGLNAYLVLAYGECRECHQPVTFVWYCDHMRPYPPFVSIDPLVNWLRAAFAFVIVAMGAYVYGAKQRPSQQGSEPNSVSGQVNVRGASPSHADQEVGYLLPSPTPMSGSTTPSQSKGTIR